MYTRLQVSFPPSYVFIRDSLLRFVCVYNSTDNCRYTVNITYGLKACIYFLNAWMLIWHIGHANDAICHAR